MNYFYIGKRFIVICSFILLNLSCTQNVVNERKEEGFNLMIGDSINNRVDELLLSDVADNIEIILLETNKESVFNYIFSLAIGENDIFVNSMNKVQHFNLKNGNYIDRIGSLGNGPTDFYYCAGVGLDDKDKFVYLYSGVNANNEIKCYTYSGSFVESKRIAPPGSWMEEGRAKGEYRGYMMLNNIHVVRRMLPIQDGTRDIWQIRLFDKSIKEVATFVDPANLKYKNEINKNQLGTNGFEIYDVLGFWSSDSPVLNQYDDNINILFDSNDTVYCYNEKDNSLRSRFILHCGDRPAFDEIRREEKKISYFQYIFVTNFLETKDRLFLVAEQYDMGYLLCVDKNTGAIQSIKRKGEISELDLSKAYIRKAPPPGLTNDLCGGLPFFPRFHTKNKWIGVYEATDLLEQIDVDNLKNMKVKFPEKRDRLVEILETIKDDDNPVIMIVNLK